MTYETIILIPNYNGKEHLEECFSSLLNQSYKKFKIILIDDASTDDSIDYTRKRFPNINILAFNKNQNFAKSINRGIRFSIEKFNPKYIALLNNDTRVDKDWLKNLVKSIESEKKIAAVASNMILYSQQEIINSHGAKFNFLYGKDLNFLKKQNQIKEFPKEVLSSCFGATLIKTECLNKIGLTDGRYTAYFEDLDWGWRANIYGYKIIFEKDAIVYHKLGSSWKNRNLKKMYLCVRNSLCTVIKNYETLTMLAIMPLLGIYLFGFSIAYLIDVKVENNKISRVYKEKTNFIKRLRYSIIPLKAIIWNMRNLKQSLKLRKEIQLKRKISDSKITKLFYLEL